MPEGDFCAYLMYTPRKDHFIVCKWQMPAASSVDDLEDLPKRHSHFLR